MNVLLMMISALALLLIIFSVGVNGAPSPTTEIDGSVANITWLSTDAIRPGVLFYDSTVVRPSDFPKPSWAAYDHLGADPKERSSASDYDDSLLLAPSGMCMPFFQMTNAQIYISSNGFLTVMPTALCSHFCISNPTYRFSETELGGDWPMLGLYVVDLDPTSSLRPADSGIYVRNNMTKVYDDVEISGITIVEYYHIPKFSTNTKNTPTLLVAQAELWPNGTIIFRYSNVLSEGELSGVNSASVGLIWTRLQRVVVDTPAQYSSAGPNVEAIRFSPIEDLCLKFTECESCAKIPACTWCNATKTCSATFIYRDVCPGGDSGNICEDKAKIVSGDDQIFYSMNISQSNDWYDIKDSVYATKILVDSSRPAPEQMEIDLDFSFPFFHPLSAHPDGNYLHERIVRKVSLAPSQVFSVLTTDHPCFRRDGQCVPYDYVFAICPFFSQTAINSGLTVMVQATLPARPYGEEEYCYNLVGCEKSIVIQVDDLERAWNPSQDDGGLKNYYSFQTVLSADGTVSFQYMSSVNVTAAEKASTTLGGDMCASYSAFFEYPMPVIGLTRHGINDPSSAIVPPNSIGYGTRVEFTSKNGCPDCGINGTCDAATKFCKCGSNFDGRFCEKCAEGYYGLDCVACPACLHSGTCNDGRNGTGKCSCVGQYSGERCEVLCDASVNVTCENECHPQGGTCVCGVCKCNSQQGWFGDTCSDWEDPCNKYSLDGCSTCLTAISEVHKCKFCLDYRCVTDVPQSGVDHTRVEVCGRGYEESNLASCPSYTRRTEFGDSFAVIAVVITFGGLGMCSCFILVVVCACRGKRKNPLETNAVTGTPNFVPMRHDRMIIQFQTVHKQGPHGRRVQGIPLKQIELTELVKFQRERKMAVEE